MFTSRYDDAIAQLQRVLELEPGYFIARNFLAFIYGLKSMFEESIAEYKRSVELARSSTSLAGLGTAYAMAGRKDEAWAVLEDLENGTGLGYISPVSHAQIYVQLGEKDRALEYLERGYEERDPWLLWNKVNPAFDSLRSEPRFKDLLARIGL